MIKEIFTERLILTSDWRDEFIKPLTAINNDPQVLEFLPKALSEEETLGLVNKIRRNIEENGFDLFACQLRENDEFTEGKFTEGKLTGVEFIGWCGFHKIDFQAHFTPAIEIGWRFSSKYWGKGYATEAAKACLEFGFDELGLSEIVSFTVPQNLRSIRVMEKIGLTRDLQGDFAHPKLPPDHPLSPHILYR